MSRSLIVRAVAVLMVALSGVLLAPALASAESAQVLGVESRVWDYTNDRCDDGHYPDQPARAFRRSNGQVTLTISSSFFNGRMLGPSLNTVVGDKHVSGVGCANTLPNNRQSHPSLYRYDEWINSTYRIPFSDTVYGLVHNEWIGEFNSNEAQSYCSDDDRGLQIAHCWNSSVTQIASTNGGASYQPVASPPNHLAVNLPYRYVKDWGQHGWGEITNIVWHPGQGHFYALAPVRSFTNEDPAHPYPPDPSPYPAPNSTSAPNADDPTKFGAQKRGICAIRTPTIGTSPATWKAWNGTNFDTTFMNPYTSSDAPENHVCEPVQGLWNTMTPESLTYSEYFGKFLLVGTNHNAVAGRKVGIHFSLSDDLVHWSEPKLILEKPTTHHYQQLGCPANQRAFAYPVVLDPLDTSENFDHPGQYPYLYYTRFNSGGVPCDQLTNDRDLWRVPIRFSKDRTATFEDNAINDPDTGFDAGDGALSLVGSNPTPYEGSKALQALYWPNTDAMGTFFEAFPQGSDVWYGAAFNLAQGTGGFAASNEHVSLLEWSNATRSVHGGIALRAGDDSVRAVRGTTSNPADDDVIGPPFSLPSGQWFWLEVHQRLNQTNPLTEVYLNNALISASQAANSFPDSSGIPTRVRFGLDANQSSAILAYLDRASVSTSQRGALGAPTTPTGLSGTPDSQMVLLNWNAVAGAAGYVVYRQDSPTDIWVGRHEVATTAALDLGLQSCHTYRYRVASKNTAGVHSLMSPAITVQTTGC